jgi:hypothetical protein
MQDFGESVSLAYVMIAPRLDLPHGTPEWEPLTSGHGNLRRWLDRMNARVWFQPLGNVASIANAA